MYIKVYDFLSLGVRLHRFLHKDVVMPPPLTCNETNALLLDCMTWMSSGPTKSVLHSDHLDNINCLFRGSKVNILYLNYCSQFNIYVSDIKDSCSMYIQNSENRYNSCVWFVKC